LAILEAISCADGNSDRAIRDFESRRRDLRAQPKRLRYDILCHRDSATTVRIWWNSDTPEPLLGATIRERDVDHDVDAAAEYRVLNVPAVAIAGVPHSTAIGAFSAYDLVDRLRPFL
jgi:hypothetical protein